MSLYNDKGLNSVRGNNPYIYVCAQHWSIWIPKAYIKTDQKGEKDSNTIKSRVLLTPTFRNRQYSIHKVKKEPAELNCTLDQLDLTNIYRTFYPTATEYIFSTARGTFSGTDHDRSQNKSQQI